MFLDALELVGGREIDGDVDGAGAGIGFLTVVDGASGEAMLGMSAHSSRVQKSLFSVQAGGTAGNRELGPGNSGLGTVKGRPGGSLRAFFVGWPMVRWGDGWVDRRWGVHPLGGGSVASGSIRRGSGRALLDYGKLLSPSLLRGRFGRWSGGLPGLGGFAAWALSSPKQKSLAGARLLPFLLYKFRISGWKDKTANFL